MGLNKKLGYVSSQSAVGGCRGRNQYLELFVSGEIEKTSAIVRKTAEQAGGFVAVARNPINREYVQSNGAPGAIKQAINIGKAMLAKESEGPMLMIESAVREVGGEILSRGLIDENDLKTEDGFDIGSLIIKSIKGTFIIDVCNEYITLEYNGERLATFPDLILLMNAETGFPVISAEANLGLEVYIVKAPKEKLILGAGMFLKENYSYIERLIGKDIISYVF